MLLGIHSFDENEAFMILKADSYETAYSGMLAWEESIYPDFIPLFSRTPSVHIQPSAPAQDQAAAPIGTTTASSSPAATSTPTATPVATSTPVVQALPYRGNFIDQIVENHDARVMLNQYGDILLLWTFLDRSTIVITTNEATLREVISRISQANIISLPPSK
jgi:hypothetical protein